MTPPSSTTALRPRPDPRRRRHHPLLHLHTHHPGLREAVPGQDARAVRRQRDGAASERGHGVAVREEARRGTDGGRGALGGEWASFWAAGYAPDVLSAGCEGSLISFMCMGAG